MREFPHRYICKMDKDKSIQVFEFDGNGITFKFENGEKFVSATQMVHMYDKRLNDFFRLKQTAEFIKELYLIMEGENADLPKLKNPTRPNTESLARAYPKLIKTIKGGDPYLQGTWVHERLSLKLAAWLSPRFEVWVYDTILQIMKSDSIVFTGTEKTTFEWFLTKISNNVNELNILLNDMPGQLPENKTIFLNEEEDNELN